MAQTRKPYAVTIGGVEHTLLLDSEDAARLGASARAVKANAEPDAEQDAGTDGKARQPMNKARSAPERR